ncbi:CocE/NonD family hydrolase [Streptomyces sp. HD1123-B1]|uniref:CocE/NonD family hydrolase n=1 Tax=Streptomyces huangiella TaxID=3228804 RepID=UPI003D7D3047
MTTPTTETGTTHTTTIPLGDGVRLAATLYLPVPGPEPVPVLLEALPYRKDDHLGVEARPEYLRFRDEYRFAVCRVDLRGTGSSEGYADDEYPEREPEDLCEVIAWLAGQPWCNGSVGMFGTSYSGFNAFHAAMRAPEALKAIVPIYSSDDRYTDDVHYLGGALRAVDLIDYPLYLAAMNALPPVPALAGPDWRETWHKRMDTMEPWLLSWLENQRHGAFWRRGSIRPDYDLVRCPTMIVQGWADGYRNNSFRTISRLQDQGTPYRLLIGPWSHMSTQSSLPGPWIDLVPEMARWFDRWLRGTDNGVDREPPISYFTRHSTRPEPDLARLRGEWRSERQWPPARAREVTLDLGRDPRELRVKPSTGTAAWIDCAGSLPWGQPSDQRYDDADSLTWEWTVGEQPLPESSLELLGHPRLRLKVSADAPVAYVSAKLSEVFPDGTSSLITRTLLNLTHRDGHDAEPRPLTPGHAETVDIELNATACVLPPGHRLRLSLAGADWPNTFAPPTPLTLTVDAAGSGLTLPVTAGPGPCPPPVFHEVTPESLPDGKGVTWTVERDVLARTTTCFVDYADVWTTHDGTVCEARNTGRVTVDERTHDQTLVARCVYTVGWPEARVTTTADLFLTAHADRYEVDITVRASEDDQQVFERDWRRSLPRDLA